MDIQLADGSSFEIFQRTQVSAPVIFTTAYDEYAIKAFKVNSIDYLLKPIDKEELAEAFQKFDTLHPKPHHGGQRSPDLYGIPDNLQKLLEQIKAPVRYRDRKRS